MQQRQFGSAVQQEAMCIWMIAASTDSSSSLLSLSSGRAFISLATEPRFVRQDLSLQACRPHRASFNTTRIQLDDLETLAWSDLCSDLECLNRCNLRVPSRSRRVNSYGGCVATSMRSGVFDGLARRGHDAFPALDRSRRLHAFQLLCRKPYYVDARSKYGFKKSVGGVT